MITRKVAVVPYDEAWKQRFAESASSINCHSGYCIFI